MIASYRHKVAPPTDVSITTQKGYIIRGHLAEIDVFQKKLLLVNAYVVGHLSEISFSNKEFPNPGPYESLTLDGEELLDVLLHGILPPAGHSSVQTGYAWSSRTSRAPSTSSSCRLSPFSGHTTPPPFYDPLIPPPAMTYEIGQVAPSNAYSRNSSQVSSTYWPAGAPSVSLQSNHSRQGTALNSKQSQPLVHSPIPQKSKEKSSEAMKQIAATAY